MIPVRSLWNLKIQVCQWQRPRKITIPPSPKKLADLQNFKTDGADKEIPQKPYPGASVDGVISCSKCGVGIFEIKCPYGKGTDKWRNKEHEECSSNKNFFAELSDT